MAGITRPAKFARVVRQESAEETSDAMSDYQDVESPPRAAPRALHSLISQVDAVHSAEMPELRGDADDDQRSMRVGTFPILDRGPMLDGNQAEPLGDEVLESSTDDSTAMSVTSSNFSLPTLVIETQPPIEVRTRTPSEKRNFTCAVMVVGPWREAAGKFIGVELLYAPQCREGDEMPKQSALLLKFFV